MKVTLFLPALAGVAGRTTGLGTLALAAEDAGFWGVAFSEHPAPSRKWLDGGGHDSYDPMLALAYCAAVTSTIRLIPCVSVLPYRNPLLSAKSIATLDMALPGSQVWGCSWFLRRVGPKRAARGRVASRAGR